MSIEDRIQSGQKTATSLWLLGAMAVAIFGAGWSTHLFLTRDVVRYNDNVALMVNYGATDYQANVDMAGSDKPVVLSREDLTVHTFRISKEP